jgi:hypothetical protein
MQENLLHFDMLNAVLILIMGIGAYRAFITRNTNFAESIKWHSEWIKKHSTECDARDKATTDILSELRTSNQHLVTLTEAQGHRLDRIEMQQDSDRRIPRR